MATLFDQPHPPSSRSPSNGVKRAQERKVFKRHRGRRLKNVSCSIHRARYIESSRKLKKSLRSLGEIRVYLSPFLSMDLVRLFPSRLRSKKAKENGCFMIGFVEGRLSVSKLCIFFFLCERS